MCAVITFNRSDNSKNAKKPCVRRRGAILVFALIYFAYLSFRMTPAISASISIWDGVGSDSEKIF